MPISACSSGSVGWSSPPRLCPGLRGFTSRDSACRWPLAPHSEPLRAPHQFSPSGRRSGVRRPQSCRPHSVTTSNPAARLFLHLPGQLCVSGGGGGVVLFFTMRAACLTHGLQLLLAGLSLRRRCTPRPAHRPPRPLTQGTGLHTLTVPATEPGTVASESAVSQGHSPSPFQLLKLQANTGVTRSLPTTWMSWI